MEAFVGGHVEQAEAAWASVVLSLGLLACASLYIALSAESAAADEKFPPGKLRAEAMPSEAPSATTEGSEGRRRVVPELEEEHEERYEERYEERHEERHDGRRFPSPSSFRLPLLQPRLPSGGKMRRNASWEKLSRLNPPPGSKRQLLANTSSAYLRRLGLFDDSWAEKEEHRKVVYSGAVVAAAVAQARQLQRGIPHEYVLHTDPVSQNRLGFHATSQNADIAEAMGRVHPYQPPGLYNNHVFSVGPTLLLTEDVAFEREVFEATLDGFPCAFAVDWLHPAGAGPDTPVALIVPGFAGCSKTPLYAWVARQLQTDMKVRVAVVHDRGEGGVPLRSHRMHHKTDVRLLDSFVDSVRERFKKQKQKREQEQKQKQGEANDDDHDDDDDDDDDDDHDHDHDDDDDHDHDHDDDDDELLMLGLGFSQGGALLVKYLQHLGSRRRLAAVMTVGSSYDYPVGLAQLEGTMGFLGRLYSLMLAKKHLRFITQQREVFEKASVHGFDYKRALSADSLRALDEALARSIYGHADVLDYHRSFNLASGAHRIGVPVLCLHAGDDPLFSTDAHLAQRHAARVSERIVFMQVPRGGHISFTEEGMGSSYAFRVAKEFFALFLSETSSPSS